jgi:hypothetical protein
MRKIDAAYTARKCLLHCPIVVLSLSGEARVSPVQSPDPGKGGAASRDGFLNGSLAGAELLRREVRLSEVAAAAGVAKKQGDFWYVGRRAVEDRNFNAAIKAHRWVQRRKGRPLAVSSAKRPISDGRLMVSKGIEYTSRQRGPWLGTSWFHWEEIVLWPRCGMTFH